MPTRSITLLEVEQNALLSGTIPATLIKKIKSAQKPRSARYSKNKGAGFQKDVAGWIADLFKLEWDNEDDHSPIKTRAMGSSGLDLIMQEPLYSMFPYDVEIKNVENLSVPVTVNQVQNNTKIGRQWLIVWKNKKFDIPVVIMNWNSFAKLWQKE